MKPLRPRPAASSSWPPIDEEKEARELDAHRRTLDPVSVAATDWHDRWTEGLSPAEDAEFRKWRAADPAHDAAFLHLVQSMRLLRSLTPEQRARLRAAPDAPDARTLPRPADAVPRGWPALRPGLVAAGCVALLAAGIAWQQWRQPVFTAAYATQRGQISSHRLPDGSELSLDALSRAEVVLYRDRREARVVEGQVMFSVAPGGARSFHVLAGPSRITVDGTRFSVCYRAAGSQAGIVDVAVEAGRVSVRVAGASSAGSAGVGGVALTAGQHVRVSPAGAIGKIAPLPVDSVAAWRAGLIHFSDTPLGEAIQEIERYVPTGLVIEDEEVAALRIAGSYEIRRPDRFARLLPRFLPVRLVPRDDGKVKIVRLGRDRADDERCGEARASGSRCGRDDDEPRPE